MSGWGVRNEISKLLFCHQSQIRTVYLQSFKSMECWKWGKSEAGEILLPREGVDLVNLIAEFSKI